MTSDDARAVLMSFEGSSEGAHHGHPDFRVGGKLFATLWPDQGRSVLRLEVGMADAVVSGNPTVYKIVSRSNGGWVSVTLETVDPEEFQALAESAWNNRRA